MITAISLNNPVYARHLVRSHFILSLNFIPGLQPAVFSRPRYTLTMNLFDFFFQYHLLEAPTVYGYCWRGLVLRSLSTDKLLSTGFWFLTHLDTLLGYTTRRTRKKLNDRSKRR